MKRFLSILVAVAMTISMVLPVFAYTDTVGNDYEAAIEHLSGLGVINGYEDGSYQPAKVVTRAEMAKLLVVALGLDAGADILTGESEFADVAANHWAIGYINVATQYGLIKGDGDGNFRPDDTVNYAETATMALRALNYTTVVEKAGQWPTNYLNKANELKLFEDVVSFKASEGAKRGEVAQILWNMVNTEMWEVVSENEGNGLTSTANRTMLQVKFADFNTKSTNAAGTVVYTPNYVEGAITAVEVKNETDVKITIGSTVITFEDVTEVPVNLVGTVAEAEALYTVDKEGEKFGASLYIDKSLVVAGQVTKIDTANEKIYVNGEEYKVETMPSVAKFDIVSLNLDKDSKKVVSGAARTATNDMIIKEVKANSDGSTTYVAETGTGSNVVVDEDVDVIYVTLDGKVVAKSDVKAGMSMDAATSITADGFAFVADNKLTGKVEKIFSDDKVLTIDGVEYVLAADARIKYEGRAKHEVLSTNAMNSLVQQTITAKFTVDGEIAYIEASDELIVDNYAFITKAWDEKVEGVTVYKVRLMDLAGNTADYETYDFEAKASAALGTTAVGTFMKYELKDGKIVVKDEEGTAKVTVLTAAAVSDLNKTSETFTFGGKTVAYNANTKFVEYIVKAADYKVEMGSFKAADLDTAKTYIVIADADTNMVEYVLYKNTGDTLAEKVYGVVVEADALVGTENNTKVYATTVYDIATGKEVVLTTGDKANMAKGAVVEYTAKVDGKYEIKAATKVATAGASFDAETAITELDSYKEIALDSKVIVTADATVIFVNASNEVEVNKSIEDITANDDVYGAVKLDKVAVADTAVYSTIIVVVK